jgi:hypothetical protein
LEQAFSLDCSVAEACLFADITGDTYYKLIKDKPKLKNRFNSLREKPVLIARKTIVTSCQTNPEIAFRYLERKKRKEF